MKKVQYNDFFAYEYPYIFSCKNERKVEPILENKNTKNNPEEKDIYNKILKFRSSYGKKRRYYTDYI